MGPLFTKIVTNIKLTLDQRESNDLEQSIYVKKVPICDELNLFNKCWNIRYRLLLNSILITNVGQYSKRCLRDLFNDNFKLHG